MQSTINIEATGKKSGIPGFNAAIHQKLEKLVEMASTKIEQPVEISKQRPSRPRVNQEDAVFVRMMFKLGESVEADEYHAYLMNHDVPSYDLSLDKDGNLLAVGVDLDASFTGFAYMPKLQTILTIPREGSPTLETGTTALGAAVMIGHQAWREAAKSPQEKHTIYIALNYATGAALYESTSQPVAVAMAGSNLRTVGKILRENFPNASIMFYVNTGLCINTFLGQSWEAAKAVNALVIVDDINKFRNRNGKLTPSILLLDDRPLWEREEKNADNPSDEVIDDSQDSDADDEDYADDDEYGDDDYADGDDDYDEEEDVDDFGNFNMEIEDKE